MGVTNIISSSELFLEAEYLDPDISPEFTKSKDAIIEGGGVNPFVEVENGG